jgi:FMN reductase
MANETGSLVEEKPVGVALTTDIHSRFVVAGGIKTHFLEAATSSETRDAALTSMHPANSIPSRYASRSGDRGGFDTLMHRTGNPENESTGRDAATFAANAKPSTGGARPFIVGIGGTPRRGSSSEKALTVSLQAAAAAGAETLLICGPELNLPMYNPSDPQRTAAAQRLIEAFRRCDGIATGWQATGHTLATLRSIAHALRGWPTPLGVALNTSSTLFDETGACVDGSAKAQLYAVGRQVVEFALQRRGLAMA